jgi:hypothetical protein
MTPAPDQPPTPAPDRATCEIRDLELFAPGYHKGELYSPADVEQIAANHRYLQGLGHWQPTAKLGHDPTQRYTDSLGWPNVGFIPDDLRVSPEGKLIARVVAGVPEPVGAAINSGNLNNHSIELEKDFPDPADQGRTLPGSVLTGFGLLGEERPAVALLKPPRATFPDGTEVPPRLDPVFLSAMRASQGQTTPVGPRTITHAGGHRSTRFTICFSEMFTMSRAETLDQLRQLGVPVDDPSITGKSDEELAAYLASVQSAGIGDKAAFGAVFAAHKNLFATEAGTLPLNPSGDAASGGPGVDQLTPIEQQTQGAKGQFSAGDDQQEPDYMSACKRFSEDPKTSPENKALFGALMGMHAHLTKRMGANEAAVAGIQKADQQEKTASFSAAVTSAVDAAILRGAIARNQRDTYLTAGMAKDRSRTFSAGPHAGKTPSQVWLNELNALPANPLFGEAVDSPEPGDPLTDPWVLKAARHIPQMRSVLDKK